MDTPQLNPSDLYDKRRSKDAGRLRAYNKILEQIYNRIRTISKLPNSQCFLLYTVPPFILGLPKIDLEDCVVYLIYQLRHAGYEVRYSPPNMVHISWLHHEKSYLIEQSPIMQAMLESSERSELERKEKEASRLLSARKRKVVKQTPGFHAASNTSYNTASNTSSNTAYNTSYNTAYNTVPHAVPKIGLPYAINTILNKPPKPSAGPPRPSAGPPRPSAGDYIPPTSFIKNMTNPSNGTVYPKSVPEYFT